MIGAEGIERVEAELDQIAEKRAREAKDAAKVEEAWAEQERRHRERRRSELREEWRAFHEHMQALHASLCNEHRQKAAKLAGEGDAVA